MESSGNEKSWRIRIAGDEEYRCRELAAEAAERCSAIALVSETVLNFKEGSPRINLIPDRERIALNALSFGGIGHTVRRGIHGPVAYKRINSGGETDVRIKGGGDPLSREEVLQILIKGESSPLLLERLATIKSTREAGSIQREDRQRSASISIRTKTMDPRRVKDRVMASLSAMELPPGYSIEFDPEALKAAESVNSQIYLFILALLFCYMVIAVLKESFSFPLALLAVVPPSLSVPALCTVLLGFPVNAVSAAAFVAVAGLAINAAALTADALENAGFGAMSYYVIYRRRLPVLAATTLTTVAAALPFLFIKSNAALVVKTLSMVSALGVAVSALCAITLIPALVKLFPGLLKSKKK
jgi:multidrug efflux pump subunit AcrB